MSATFSMTPGGAAIELELASNAKPIVHAVINDIAPGDRRAEIVSSYLIAAYVGNSLPAIGIGALSRLTSSAIANIAFAGMICVFAIVGLVMGARRSERSNA